MEKYSSFRDAGTGIQPFLTPVAVAGGSSLAASLLYPFGFIIGVMRTLIIVALALLHPILVDGLSFLFIPVPPLQRAVAHLLTAIICRLVLLCVGLYWIPVEDVSRKRGRATRVKEIWSPSAGDVIVSNWVSWIEILWLAFRFNPVFVLPICPTPSYTLDGPSTPTTQTPGRRTGTGSAAIASPSTRTTSVRVPISGFRKVSLFGMLHATGKAPSYGDTSQRPGLSLEEIRKTARVPVVVFPECTTSNGRGLLRFADVFLGETAPVKGFKVFVMCVRYDPPTTLTPSLTHSIPSTLLNPLPHIFTIASSLTPLPISIRLLAPADSPSSLMFLANDMALSGDATLGEDLCEVCAALTAQMGKMKRLGQGWEDKVAFFEFRERESKKRK